MKTLKVVLVIALILYFGALLQVPSLSSVETFVSPAFPDSELLLAMWQKDVEDLGFFDFEEVMVRHAEQDELLETRFRTYLHPQASRKVPFHLRMV